MEFNNKVYLFANNEELTGWDSVVISKSLDNLCGNFKFTMVNRTGINNAVSTQEPVSIAIDGDKVLTGYIDDVNPTVNSESSIINVSGREKTCDLVDCSAIHSPGIWRNLKLEQIIRELVKPFNIKVVTNVDTGSKFSRFTIDNGERVFEAISRACAERAIIPRTSIDGELVLSGVGNNRANDALELGSNIVEISQENSFISRFSKYIVKGNSKTSGSGWDAQTINISGEATDPGVTRYRPLRVRADSNMNNALAKKKAAWEAQIRYAKSKKVTVLLNNWRQSNGVLWEPNLLTRVEASEIGISTDMLILSTEYNLTNDSETLMLTLVDPDIFNPEPKPAVKQKVNSGW